MKKLLTIDNIITTLMLLLVLKFLPIIFSIDFLDPIQNTLEDFYVSDIVFSKLRDYDEVTVDTNIVLVNIGLLDRRAIARQVEIINKYKPKVLGIDARFITLKDPSDDSLLQAAFSRVKNLVLVSELKMISPGVGKSAFDTLIKSNTIFSRYAESGFANFYINSEEFRTIREFTPEQKVGDTTELSFAAKVLEIYNPDAFNSLMSRNKEREKINYRRNIGKYRTYDIQDIFRGGAGLEKIRGKIVLMGFLGPDLTTLVTEDNFFTPMNRQYVGKSYPDMYGVAVHANIISMALDEDYIGTKPEWLSIALLFFITYFNMWLYTFIRDRYETLYEPASVAIIILESIFLFTAVIYSLYLFNTEIFDSMLRALFYALLVTPMTYESYHDSIKPLAAGWWKKFAGRVRR